MDDTLEQMLLDEHIPGMGIALIGPDGKIAADGFGYGIIEKKIPVGPDTRFRAGSLSKTVIALAILRLVATEKLTLESKLADLLPEIQFHNEWEAVQPILVVHLLEHTAGFDDMHFKEYYLPTDQSVEEISDFYELFSGSHSLKSRWQPGTRFSYSNPGYALLGCLIEKITGKPWKIAVQELVFAPLKMQNSSFGEKEEALPKEKLALGYYWDERQAFTPVPFREILLQPAGNLYTTPADLARLVGVFLARGKLEGDQWLDPAIIDRMEKGETRLAAGAGLQTGYGLGIKSTVSSFGLTYGHNGAIDGFCSEFSYNPIHHTGFVLLFNRLDIKAHVREKIANWVRKKLHEPLGCGEVHLSHFKEEKIAKMPIKIPEELGAKIPGYYQNRNLRNGILTFVNSLIGNIYIEITHDSIRVSRFLSDGTITMFHKGNGQFSAQPDGESVAIFGAITESGSTFFERELQYYEKISPFNAWSRRLFLAFSLLFMGISLPFALVSAFFKYVGKDPVRIRPRLVTAAPLICAVIIIALVASEGTAGLGTLNSSTLGIFLLSILFAVFALIGFYLSILDTYRNGFSIARIFLLTTGVFQTAMSFYLAFHGLIGLQTWAW